MSNFYHYGQNNSGGSHIVNNKVAKNVYIEAENVEQANEIALSIGIYFDGCSKGMDCSCCGDRWHAPYSAIETPKEFIEELQSAYRYAYSFKDEKDVFAIIYMQHGVRYTIRKSGVYRSYEGKEIYMDKNNFGKVFGYLTGENKGEN